MLQLHRTEEIDEEIDQQLQENLGFVDNFARGTAHMFRYSHTLWSAYCLVDMVGLETEHRVDFFSLFQF